MEPFNPIIFTTLITPVLLIFAYKFLKGWFTSPPSPGTSLWIIIITYFITTLILRDRLLPLIKSNAEQFIPKIIFQLLLSLVLFAIAALTEFWISRAYVEFVKSEGDLPYLTGTRLPTKPFFYRLFISLKTKTFNIRDTWDFYYNLFRHENFPFMEFMTSWIGIFSAIYINIYLLFG